jgi:hypothetical protein
MGEWYLVPISMPLLDVEQGHFTGQLHFDLIANLHHT